jgi:hypothetical protein
MDWCDADNHSGPLCCQPISSEVDTVLNVKG